MMPALPQHFSFSFMVPFLSHMRLLVRRNQPENYVSPEVMEALNSNSRTKTFLITLFTSIYCSHAYRYGCSLKWSLDLNSTIDNYTLLMEPDQVYTVKSPLLYRLTYPKSSLFTWYLEPSDSRSMSLMIYILFMQTEGYCDRLRISAFDQFPGHRMALNNTETAFYWSGSLEFSYDYETYDERYLALEFVRSRFAILQFNSDTHYSDVGFMIRVIPLTDHRKIIEDYAWNVELIANSTLQQLSLNPGPLSADFDLTRVTIHADQPSRRVFVKVTFMNIDQQQDCTNNFLEMYDGSDENIQLLKACRNMTISSPLPAVSVRDSLVVQYKCTTKQIYNHRTGKYEGSPCAILNYQLFEPEYFEDRFLDSFRYLEITDVDFLKPVEFAGHYLYFSVKSDEGALLLLHSDKYEYEEEVIRIQILFDVGKMTILISHQLIGEQKHSTEGSIKENHDGVEFKKFWLKVENNEVMIGSGHEIKNHFLTHFMEGNLQLKYFQVNGLPGDVYRLHGDCDEKFLAHVTPLPPGPGKIHHTVAKGSIYTRSWSFTKGNADQVVQFKVTSDLLNSPDCVWEGVTIYRGACISWHKKVATFCSKVEEFYTETTHSVVLVQFHSRADITADRAFHGRSNRFFTIEYEIYQPSIFSLKDILNIGLIIAAVLTVGIVLLIISIICYVKITKTQRPGRVNVQGAVPIQYPQMEYAGNQQLSQGHQHVGQGHQHGHHSAGQPLQLKINIDNKGQVVGIPDSLYESGGVETTVTYTGVPPPAVYHPPRSGYQEQQQPPQGHFIPAR